MQQPFDAAVIIQTIFRPTLLQAARSVFAQDCRGLIQILLGIDHVQGDPALVDQIRAECPDHTALTVIDPGYSTSRRHGSLYSNYFGDALRFALSYLANSRFVAYLNDDNWWTPHHLSTMLAAIAGKSWAFSLRSLVDRRWDEVIRRDEWESLGPGRGVYVAGFGGWVDTSCLMVDKLACHQVLPAWCLSAKALGATDIFECWVAVLRFFHSALDCSRIATFDFPHTRKLDTAAHSRPRTWGWHSDNHLRGSNENAALVVGRCVGRRGKYGECDGNAEY